MKHVSPLVTALVVVLGLAGFLVVNSTQAKPAPSAAGTSTAAAATNGARLTGHLDGGRLAGTVVADGKTYTFRIDVAKPPAGLYRGQSGSIRIGWIVLPDGSQVGIATAGGPPGPAPQLDTTSRT